ncbi:DUF2474 domain-containing protein [Granulibacter bethesdensis]|nr:DUF2474 domain-containing protein [Granulibacter bethesdensis]
MRSHLRRLAWFAGLWVAGVVAVGGVAELLHWVIRRTMTG